MDIINQYFNSDTSQQKKLILNTLSHQLANNTINIKSDIFEKLLDYFTSQESIKRQNATILVHNLLKTLFMMKKTLESDDNIRLLFVFFCGKCEDLDVTQQAIKVIELFFQQYQPEKNQLAFMTEEFINLLKKNKFFPAQHGQSIRKSCYQIFNIIVNNYCFIKQSIKNDSDNIINLIINLNDMEKDPRNLFAYFVLIQNLVYNKEFSLTGDQVYDLFQQIDNYFPVSFQKKKNDIYAISAEDLEIKIYSIFSHPLFIQHSKEVIKENMYSSQVDNLICSQILLQKILIKNSYEVLGYKYIVDIWNHLCNIMQDQDSVEVKVVIQQTIYQIINNLMYFDKVVHHKDFIVIIIDYILKNSNDQDNKMQGNFMTDILQRVGEISLSIFQYIMDKISQIFIQEVDLRDKQSQMEWLSKFVILLNQNKKKLTNFTIDQKFMNNIKEIIIFSEHIEITALAMKIIITLVNYQSNKIDYKFQQNLNEIVFQNLLKSNNLQNQQFAIDYFITILYKSDQKQENIDIKITDYLNNKLNICVEFNESVQYLWNQILNLKINKFEELFVKNFIKILQDIENNATLINNYIEIFKLKQNLFVQFIDSNSDAYLQLLEYFSLSNQNKQEIQTNIDKEIYKNLLIIIQELINEQQKNPLQNEDDTVEAITIDHNQSIKIFKQIIQYAENQFKNDIYLDKIYVINMVYLYNRFKQSEKVNEINSNIIEQIQINKEDQLYIHFYLKFISISKFTSTLNISLKQKFIDQIKQLLEHVNMNLRLKIISQLVYLDAQTSLNEIKQYLIQNREDIKTCQEYIQKIFKLNKYQMARKCVQSVFQSQLYRVMTEVYNENKDQSFKIIYLLIVINTPYQELNNNIENILQLLFKGLHSNNYFVYIQSIKLLNKFFANKQSYEAIIKNSHDVIEDLANGCQQFKIIKMEDSLIYLNCLQICADIFEPFQIGGKQKQIIQNIKDYREHPKRRVRKLAAFALHKYLYL